MNSIMDYIDGVVRSWEHGEYLEAILKVFIPLVILSIAWWLLAVLVNIVFGLIIPVAIVLFIIFLFTGKR